MAQPERVADFVHGHFLEPLRHQLLEIRGVRGARGQHRGAQRKLPCQAAVQIAADRAIGAVLAQLFLVALQVERAAGPRGNSLFGERLVLTLPELQEVGVEDHVGIQDLARVRIHPRGPHGKPGIGRDPAEGVVADIFRIPVVGVFLLPHFDGVDKTGFLKRLVPFLDAIADRLAIRVRDRFFQPESDRVFRRRHLRRRIGLL